MERFFKKPNGVVIQVIPTHDIKSLEERFVEYLNDEKKRFEVIEYAWNKLNEVYSHNSVKKQISEIIYE